MWATKMKAGICAVGDQCIRVLIRSIHTYSCMDKQNTEKNGLHYPGSSE